MILQQTVLHLEAFPQLPAHQKAARIHATNWNNIHLPVMSAMTADIIDYSNLFYGIPCSIVAICHGGM